MASLPLLVERDWNLGAVVHSTQLHLDESGEQQLRPSQHPVAHWPADQNRKKLVGALAVSGTTILGVVDDGSQPMAIHDTARPSQSQGPLLLRGPKRRPVILPVGPSVVVVMDRLLRPGASCRFEALRSDGGATWRADDDPLPEPPLAYDDEEEDDGEEIDYPVITSYFATGGRRLWISVTFRGTFSLDVEEKTWRLEGEQELPLLERGISAPDLGGAVVLGVSSDGGDAAPSGRRCCAVCALDVGVRPPALLRVWHLPAERPEEVAFGEMVSLAYLGNGRICVARSIEVELSKDVTTPSLKGRGTSFTVADVTREDPDGELRLVSTAKAHRHVWPLGHLGHAVFLQPLA
ncbi:hypothetical protein QOZ80_8BG0644230 [Eleusine coracana subsp. coracana]|nr:hypothetical protein QOZ80_8BG0644170 [Eleusine coracana subsp. coracana]KAK3120974.1 hypothetical protein QOZ80_8BG0644230 [Eleusine coracana subsp. coracana]